MSMNLPFVGIINILQADVFLVLEETVELWMMPVIAKLGQEERSIGFDEGSVTLSPISDRTTTCLQPAGLGVCLFESLAVNRALR